MKKILFVFAAVIAMSVASCGSKNAKEEVAEVDSVEVVVDTVTVDTVVVDTIVAE